MNIPTLAEDVLLLAREQTVNGLTEFLLIYMTLKTRMESLKSANYGTDLIPRFRNLQPFSLAEHLHSPLYLSFIFVGQFYMSEE